MNSKYLFSIIIVLLSFCAYAQVEPFYKSYDWEQEPNYQIAATDTDDIITYKEKIVREFYFVSKDELTEYEILHKIVWLNSDEQIEKNNKIYLPYSSSTELILTKARVITKENKIILLDESKILSAEDEETKQIYKYFTFEGVEKGSFVEYMYVLKKYPTYLGTRLDIQDEHPKYNVEFDLYSPTNLIFEIKSYNGLDSVLLDTNEVDKLRWTLKIDSMPPLEDERLSYYMVYKKYLIYKLDKNLITRNYDISSYGDISKNVYSFLYDNTTKSHISGINKLIKNSKSKDEANLHNKIRVFEDYIKKTVYQIDANNNDLRDLTFILKNNIASKTGILKLFAIAFQQMEIDCQLVMTCDRSVMKFDKDFQANNFLEEYLFYFPAIKTYMSPNDIGSRLGFPTPVHTFNYGLFIKEVTLGDFKTGLGKINFINPVTFDKNFDNILIDLKFEKEDLTKVNMNIERSSNGYYAMFIQPYMHLLDEKAKTEVIEAQLKSLSENIEVAKKEVFNDNVESFGYKPFIVKAEVNSEDFVEKAGNKYLFKVGLLIGAQMEMYQKKKRVLPLENEFTHKYHREINVEIPEGYKITNLNDININNFYKKDGEILFKFSSSYTIDGNKLQVLSDEYYKLIEIAPELFEEYRTVLNSAADFNKVVLILEPNN